MRFLFTSTSLITCKGKYYRTRWNNCFFFQQSWDTFSSVNVSFNLLIDLSRRLALQSALRLLLWASAYLLRKSHFLVLLMTPGCYMVAAGYLSIITVDGRYTAKLRTLSTRTFGWPHSHFWGESYTFLS